MKQLILPHYLQGTLAIPSSKSYTQRAFAAALLAGGTTHIYNAGISNDDNAALNVVQQLGATVSQKNTFLSITSNFTRNLKSDGEALKLHLSESGLGLRMFTPIVALLSNTVAITGSGSLTTRPMHTFNEVLPQLDVQLITNNGYLPFTVKGPLNAKDITVDGSLSSQFLTGLLLAYSYANTNATITVQQLTSKPYIDVTLSVLQAFGLNVPLHNNYETFTFTTNPIPQSTTRSYTVEADWSSASFMLVAASINGNCTFTGLNSTSVQADKKILEALQHAGANITVTEKFINVSKSALHGFNFDATQCPDLFPPLVALAANAVGTTTITGLSRLAHKESNRGITLQQQFANLGISIILQDDVMIIHGKGNIQIVNANCHSCHDHRIAMALAVSIVNQPTPIVIDAFEAIDKSYPNFYTHLQSLQKP